MDAFNAQSQAVMSTASTTILRRALLIHVIFAHGPPLSGRAKCCHVATTPSVSHYCNRPSNLAPQP